MDLINLKEIIKNGNKQTYSVRQGRKREQSSENKSEERQKDGCRDTKGGNKKVKMI